MNHYTYRVEWSQDHAEYVGVCLELPFLAERAVTAHDAMAAIVAAVDRKLVEMREFGDPVPAPLNEAVEQHVSMNQWVVHQLSGRELPSSLGLFGLD